MFTGIVETTGKIIDVADLGSNRQFLIQAPFLHELKIDQSVAHNGACLTVDGLSDSHYTVTAIAETLQRTNLAFLQPGNLVNLERSMKLNDRLDGHIVQGHVDTIGKVLSITSCNGSWEFEIGFDNQQYVTVSKGSITVNGVSLTVVKSYPGGFSVAIIPYTYNHTQFVELKVSDFVNLEFDIIGKYVERLLKGYK
ncbi:MAG: riboflavin synthase [Candidatus Competibacteraceae bacterium]|nr:riboflavin synthase [Candidatus Competibacteraceae bacterium]